MTKNVVLYIDAMIMPDKNAAAQRASAICKSLLDIGRIPVVVGLDNEVKTEVSITKTKKNYYGIDCYAIKYPQTIFEWIKRMTTIRPFKEVMSIYGLERIDAIIAMDYEVIALYRIRKFCKKNKIKVVADSVEWYGKSRLPFPMGFVKNIDTKLRMEYLYPKFDYMICISTYLKKHFEKSVKNVIEIPGTIDKKDMKWSEIQEYKANPIFTIGYAGNPGIEFDKERLDWLVEAVYELNKEGRPCRLIMAGFDKEILENKLEHLINTAIFKDRILCLGVISHIECLNMIASCEFSAIVRDDNRITRAGFPTKFSESFGCGTPIITTASSNVADFIVEGRTGYLCDGFSKESVKKTINRAMELSHDELVLIHLQLKASDVLNYDRYTNILKKILEK